MGRDAGKWTGHDIADFVADQPPSYRPSRGATGVAAISGDDAFIMQADGKAWLYAPAGLLDGPLPTHYEPEDSPLHNLLYPSRSNPVREILRSRATRTSPAPPSPGRTCFPTSPPPTA